MKSVNKALGVVSKANRSVGNFGSKVLSAGLTLGCFGFFTCLTSWSLSNLIDIVPKSK